MFRRSGRKTHPSTCFQSLLFLLLSGSGGQGADASSPSGGSVLGGILSGGNRPSASTIHLRWTPLPRSPAWFNGRVGQRRAWSRSQHVFNVSDPPKYGSGPRHHHQQPAAQRSAVGAWSNPVQHQGNRVTTPARFCQLAERYTNCHRQGGRTPSRCP